MISNRFAMPGDDDKRTTPDLTARKILEATNHLKLTLFKTTEGRTALEFELQGIVGNPEKDSREDEPFLSVDNDEAQRTAIDLLAAFLK